MRLTWRKIAALSTALGLLLLVVHPAAGVALAAAMVLSPVLLFGLVMLPLLLWPSVGIEPGTALPILQRAERFQRPPPVSLL